MIISSSEQSKLMAPPVTPERLYLQDKRRRDWDEKERAIDREIARARRLGYLRQ